MDYDKTMLQELAAHPGAFDTRTIGVIAEAALRKIARLEGYAEGRDRMIAAARDALAIR